MPVKSKQKRQYVTTFRSVRRALVHAAIAVATAVSLPASAQAPAPSSGGDLVTVNFVNADIQSVIKSVGQYTGKNFIVDPRVNGTVNIVSDKPVSKDLLYQIFLSALRVQGYAAVEEGNFVKIIP